MQTSKVRYDRLPGVRFEVQTPALDESFPRMDVAGFVGFAAKGPMQQPVPLEDVAQFEATFGADLPLAWDAKRSEVVRAYLAGSVRAFFRNGGKRCWVVRVGDLSTARANQFVVPGLVSESGTSVLLQARSVGSWSDAIKLSTRLERRALIAASKVEFLADTLELTIASDSVLPGEMICLRCFDFGVMAVVQNLEPIFTPTAQLKVTLDKPFWFSSQAPEVAFDPAQKASVFGRRTKVLPSLNAVPLELDPEEIEVQSEPKLERRDQQNLIVMDLKTPQHVIASGSSLRLKHGDATLFLTTLKSQQADKSKLQLSGLGLWQCEASKVKQVFKDQPDTLRVERLRLEMRVTDSDGQKIQLHDLGFDALHPRFVGALPTDEALFERLEVEWKLKTSPSNQSSSWANTHLELGSSLPDLWREALATGFGLAGLDSNLQTAYPVGLDLEFSPALGRLETPESALERDGLQHFGEQLFLDPDLRQTQVFNLSSSADAIRYEGSSPRSKLQGIHALFNLDEVTLLTVPDALHRNWNLIQPDLAQANEPPIFEPQIKAGFKTCANPLARAPELKTRVTPDLAGNFSLEWTVAGVPENLKSALRYRLEQYSSAPEAQVFTDLEAEIWNITAQPSGNYKYRVRAELLGLGACETDLFSPWSNTLPVTVNRVGKWQLEDENKYDATNLLRIQRALLRLCAARGDVFAVLGLPAHYRDQQTLEHLKKLRYLSGLSRESSTDLEVPVLGFGEANALSYGAVYHPWLTEQMPASTAQTTRAGTPSLCHLPPDGAMLGVYAERALNRGAWVSPANRALKNVLTLEPRLNPDRRLELLEGFLNPIWQEPHGILCLSAQTLSLDPDLSEVNVRRLLSLLRRLALQVGSRLVFESNDGVLQRLAERLFENVLEQMFKRGAFKGRSAASSYRVRAGSDLNPPANLETGFLVVEIQVAPSKPLYFLTVRLIQNGNQGLLILEGNR